MLYLRGMVLCMQAIGRCPGRSGKPLYAVSPFPHDAGSHCMLSVCSRTMREATVRCQSVPARCGKPLYAVSLFPHDAGSHCTLSVGRRMASGVLNIEIVNTKAKTPLMNLAEMD
ncbi:MAG: hypothetical protein LBL07_09775 [Tannerella sp.]|nr:hypothetical protein [Tannerella sp.]